MLNEDKKRQVDRLWEDIKAEGVSTSENIIDQITNLLYIYLIDEHVKELEGCALYKDEETPIFNDSNKRLRWSEFKNLNATDVASAISDFFKFAKDIEFSESNDLAKIQELMIYANIQITNPASLRNVVNSMEDIFGGEDKDTYKDIYEYLISKLGKNTTQGGANTITPRHIVKLMVDLVEPRPDDILYAPACGTGGFLIEAKKYLKEEEQFKEVCGEDNNSRILKVATMNIILHNLQNTHMKIMDSLAQTNTKREKYTMVLANPPFNGPLDQDSVAADLLRVQKNKKTELLFLALMLRSLKKGGKCAVVVPKGKVLTGKVSAAIRKEIVENNQLEAIISMPSSVFAVSTAILIFTKAGSTEKVWFYDMKADGFSLDDKRNPIDNNDIPDIIERFHNLENEKDRKKTDQSFFVTKEELVENNYGFSISNYQEYQYDELEYEEVDTIFNKIDDIEIEIDKALKYLKNILK